MNPRILCAVFGVLLAARAPAAPSSQDRVYTADQNSNTVSVIDPSSNTLLGQIRLGNQRPDVLSPLYKGEINVHGLGFSPDHRTLVAVANGSNSVTFIDTATNQVKGVAYIGRSPHEGFFTADGREAWVVVRGESHISVIDPKTFRETRRIETAPGPGMVLFHPDGKRAFVVSSFTPVVEVIDVRKHKVVRQIPVTSPFSPFLQLTPDGGELWMTHKDVGKVTRIDTRSMEVKEVFDTGMITNHLAFAKGAGGLLAYVSVGGENLVKVFSTGPKATPVTTIPVGALPHGIWASEDGSRVYVGLENGDAVDVIDTSANKVVARVPVGQAPQALVYLARAVASGDGRSNLIARTSKEPVNIALRAVSGEGKGFIVARNLGLTDALEVSLFKLKPKTVYSVYASGQREPVAVFETNPMGSANGTAIGPMRAFARGAAAELPASSQIVVMEGTLPADPEKAALLSQY